MTTSTPKPKSKPKIVAALQTLITDARSRHIMLLGFASGLPLLLIFGSLSVWLREAGVDRSVTTLFSWGALAFSFKFIWAPIVDKLPIPGLRGALGQRGAWLICAQTGIIIALLLMAWLDPATHVNAITMIAIGVVLLGFSAATQDIVIDAYRIEIAPADMQAWLASVYIAGYRIGMLVSGAGALFLATWFAAGDGYEHSAWQQTYWSMAAIIGFCLVCSALIVRRYGENRPDDHTYSLRDYLGLVGLFLCAIIIMVLVYSAVPYTTWVASGSPLINTLLEGARLGTALTSAYLAGWLLLKTGLFNRTMIRESWVAPIVNFFDRYGRRTAWFLLLLIGTYRISDIVLGVIANVFYVDLGFDKSDIAEIAKTFGLFMTIFGGFAGGVIAIRFGVMRALLAGAILTVITNLLFIVMAGLGPDKAALAMVIAADNLTGGIANAAFIAFLAALTDIRFTATQYAIFSSLMTLIPKLIGGYSGAMVNALGYEGFFLMASLMGVPIVIMVIFAGRLFKLAPLKTD